MTFDICSYMSAASASSCGPPPFVKNAQIQTGGASLQNVTYICNEGQQLDGPKTLTCLANGTWSMPPPTCAGTEGKLWVLICGFLSKS